MRSSHPLAAGCVVALLALASCTDDDSDDGASATATEETTDDTVEGEGDGDGDGANGGSGDSDADDDTDDTVDTDDTDDTGDTDSGGGAGQTEDDVAEAARAFSEAMLSGDSTYEYLSLDCQEQYTEIEWDLQMQFFIEFAEAFAEISFTDLTVGEVTISDFEPERAMVSVELLTAEGEQFDDSGEDDASEMVYEDGAWRIPDCEGFGFDESVEEDVFDEPADGAVDTIDGELRPADEVAEERAREQSTDGVVGETVTVEGLDVIVSSIEFDTGGDADDDTDDGDEELLRVAVRVENRTTDDSSTPEIVVVCLDGERGTARFTSDPDAYEPYSDLPSGSFEEGVAQVIIPEPCEQPVVRVQVFGFDPIAADFEVPAR